jgi:hypothetical protein
VGRKIRISMSTEEKIEAVVFSYWYSQIAMYLSMKY